MGNTIDKEKDSFIVTYCVQKINVLYNSQHIECMAAVPTVPATPSIAKNQITLQSKTFSLIMLSQVLQCFGMLSCSSTAVILQYAFFAWSIVKNVNTFLMLAGCWCLCVCVCVCWERETISMQSQKSLGGQPNHPNTYAIYVQSSAFFILPCSRFFRLHNCANAIPMRAYDSCVVCISVI